MRLTSRCIAILTLVSAGKWLTTGQLKRRFFAHASADACRKRLRALAKEGYLIRRQAHCMAEAVFAVGSEGRRALEKLGVEGSAPERRPPRQLDHLVGINDLRIAAELTGGMSHFFACWELPALKWSYPIIPDAVFSVGSASFAAEFDRGMEGLRFFVRTKLPFYDRGLAGLPLAGVVVIAENRARMDSLARVIGERSGSYWFTTIDQLRRHTLAARIFWRSPDEGQIALV